MLKFFIRSIVFTLFFLISMSFVFALPAFPENCVYGQHPTSVWIKAFGNNDDFLASYMLAGDFSKFYKVGMQIY